MRRPLAPRDMKVFLGGTCNNSKWREEVISQLKIDYFNPVVEDWTPECMKEEIKQRDLCDFCLYVITPKMSSVYSIAEVVDDSNKKPGKTIFCFLEKDDGAAFSQGSIKSLHSVGLLIKRNGGNYFASLTEVINLLNNNKLIDEFIERQ